MVAGLLKGQKIEQLQEAQLFKEIKRSGWIKNFEVAIDVGAHVGSWSVLMAPHFKRVIAFEPNRTSFDFLCENTSRLDNVELWHAGAADEECRLEDFSPLTKRGQPKRTLTSVQTRKVEDGAIRGIPLDFLGNIQCGFIKIDVEGFEWHVLKGAQRLIESARPTLCIEFTKRIERTGLSMEQLQATVLKMGYEEVYRQGVDRVFLPT